MKYAQLTLALSILFATSTLTTLATTAHAGPLSCDHVRWAGHHDPSEARIAITTEDGSVTLLLTDREVAMQLSERMVQKVRRELRNREDRQNTAIGMAIASAVMGTVRELIDDSFACCVHDLRDVSYKRGRLLFTGRNGKPVFENVEICDSDVLSSFSESDARNFVRAFRKVKAGG